MYTKLWWVLIQKTELWTPFLIIVRLLAFWFRCRISQEGTGRTPVWFIVPRMAPWSNSPRHMKDGDPWKMATSLRVVSSHTTKNKRETLRKSTDWRVEQMWSWLWGLLVGLWNHSKGARWNHSRGARPCVYHFGFSCIGCYSAGSKERNFALWATAIARD